MQSDVVYFKIKKQSEMIVGGIRVHMEHFSEVLITSQSQVVSVQFKSEKFEYINADSEPYYHYGCDK